MTAAGAAAAVGAPACFRGVHARGGVSAPPARRGDSSRANGSSRSGSSLLASFRAFSAAPCASKNSSFDRLSCLTLALAEAPPASIPAAALLASAVFAASIAAVAGAPVQLTDRRASHGNDGSSSVGAGALKTEPVVAVAEIRGVHVGGGEHGTRRAGPRERAECRAGLAVRHAVSRPREQPLG